MSITHTPAPWAVHPGLAQVDAFTPHPQPVCRMLWPTDMRSEAETEANARLIAAAPEMLAALEAVVRVADRATKEFDAARAAISKAVPA